MPFNGSGTFTLTQDFIADRDAGPPASAISADKMMDVLNDIAAGLMACQARDGENSPTNNISWAGFRLTSLANPTAAEDAINASEVANSQVAYGGLCGGTNAAMTVSNTFLDAPGVGTTVRATAIFNNAATPTLEAGGLTGPIIEKDGTAIQPKRIIAAQSFGVQWDGANWVLIETGNKIFDTSLVALNAISALVPAADQMAYYSGTTAGALTALTSYARTLLAAADVATAQGVLGFFPAGTLMSFFQTSAPTGWTKSTTHNDKVPRIVSGSASSGGSTAFSTIFAARTIARANLPNVSPTFTGTAVADHVHGVDYYQSSIGFSHGASNDAKIFGGGDGTQNSDPAGAHTPAGAISSINGGVTQTTFDMAVQYVDMIIASKN